MLNLLISDCKFQLSAFVIRTFFSDKLNLPQRKEAHAQQNKSMTES
jgi:hypothetical protein